ncbi:MAG TPA: thioredoxin domain-containing protein [Acetobacteraceae bacterium]|nr:thioredoxin domain-containing protein [Acetobacteraceae bacterium]
MAAPENLLRHETSPYLLQHAGNPVHWRPWGAAALEEARTEQKPILLSIGYAACHWCHVMAHESFEDPDTAALMNQRFVNIKVDREERPDIDHLYMSALHALGEQGGWPLTMFVAPDGAPFWGGTYFPPEPRWGRPSFRQVLQGVSDAYRTDHEMVAKNTAALRQALARMSTANPGDLPTPVHLDAVAAALLRLNDPEHGGLRGAPKFPNPPIFRFLWQNAFRTGAPEGQEALHLMLQRMSQGGIYDHLGGGYARYSTDAIWLVPHFEKMLYDNAQLLELLALAHAHRPDPLYAQRAEETVGWMVRDMTAERMAGRAAFAASEDADSEGEEGRFYVWTETEVDALLGDASTAFKRAYDVTPGGNWEGHTILRRITPGGSAEDEAALAHSRAVLFAARAKRVRPGRDDKVLADWNGLAIAALARAAVVFGRPEWLACAGEAQDFILAEMSAPDGRVQHAWRLGRVTAAGLLDDQAAMARASLALFEATGEQRRLSEAIRLAEAAQTAFADGHGGYFTTAADAADVPLARPRTAADNATPAGNGLLAEVFARLWHLTGDVAWRERCEALLRAFTGNPGQLAAMPTLLASADLLEEAATVVIAGDPQHPLAQALAATALASADPTVVVLRAPMPDSLPAGHPAFGKSAGSNGAAAYVCRHMVCGLPIAVSKALAATLSTRAG